MTQELIQYITKAIDQPIQADEELLSTGLIDSITIMKVIAYLEETYQVKVPPQDMVIENFNTVNSISDYVTQLKAKL
ncbi:acyl carrier protein [Algoriphagus halophytocola]|uniref:Acyl carrier protein n=1 Tax=Algoriphagus halophytocola TaxID=2991499 RepID=A0ABY6MMQ2_9BACT|nr:MULTISPECIES: acyl carrier protein [unclassified Algoriphagus]UZD23484.1 acyl carrier protein [Algoriphagus sp. TR-M5]WBL44778.1 acyl carrier protein [Algoriphagus sp. TR-M9]